MKNLIECQLAIVPWGTRARYRRGKIGLVRKGPKVYLFIWPSKNRTKFPIQPSTIQVLPSAIRIKDIQSDLFIQCGDDNKFSEMVRGIRVILREDELRRSGKGDKLDRFILDIPPMSSLNQNDLRLGPVSTRIGLNEPTNRGVDHNHLMPVDNATIGLSERELAYYHQVVKSERKRLENSSLRCIKSVGLYELPDQLWLANSLNELQLIDCNISIVPKQLENLAPTLRYLDLSRNTIEKLPRTFCCKMTRLSYLNLSYNLIETLPLEIKFLRQLYEFNISNNRLRMLPTTLSDLRRLKVLRVGDNKLSQLPAFRREEIRLNTLDISNNPLDGAMRNFGTFEVHSSYNDDEHDPYTLSFMSSPLVSSSPVKISKVPSLFELSILNIVRSDKLFKLASEEPLPKTIVSIIQRDIFKCYQCNKMNILPAYNSTDTLDYVDQVDRLISSGNYKSAMTFMKLLCRNCFDYMTS